MIDLLKGGQNYLAPIYKRHEFVMEKGNGRYAYDTEGKEYLDLTGGIGVNVLGFCNEKWVRAITEQSQRMNHASNLFYQKENIELAKMLCERIQMSKAIFVNSGAEANEAAIKIARKHGHESHENKHEIICLENSFHGRTMMALSATGQETYHRYFEPFDMNFKFTKVNDIEMLISAVNENTCAIMMEMVQGEGGVIPLDKEFVQAAAQICKDKKILLMIDEVQTGIGRTGTLLAYEQFHVKPDVVTLAKGLGGGLPIGVVLLGVQTADVLQAGQHGSTFGGNPIVCAGSKVILETLDEAFLDEVKIKGKYLIDSISKLPKVVSVTGMGLMIGAKFEGIEIADLIAQCKEKGLLILSAKDKMRLLPALNITMEEIDKSLKILKKVLEEANNRPQVQKTFLMYPYDYAGKIKLEGQ